MFRKDKSIKIKGSTSPLCNNLSVLVNTEKSLLNYAVIHKQVMNIVTASADGSSVIHRQVVCKDPTATHGSTVITQDSDSTQSTESAVETVDSSDHSDDGEMFQNNKSRLNPGNNFAGQRGRAKSHHRGKISNDFKEDRSKRSQSLSKRKGTLFEKSKWIVLPSRTLLVLTSLRGIQMFEADGSALVHWHSLGDVGGDGPAAEQNNFGRGIGSLGDDFICIGTQKGNILVFIIPPKGSNIKLQETLKAHKFPVTDISYEDTTMASADDDGNIIVWKRSGDSVKKILNISGCGSPCNSIVFWRKCIAAAYGSGHIRLYSADKGCLSAEVTAHARTINSLDVAKDSGLLVSAGEDSFVRVWKIIDGAVPHIEHKFSEVVPDVQLMGSRFLHKEGKALALTSYDNTDLTFFVQC